MPETVWVADTSSLLEIRTVAREHRPAVFLALSGLVAALRLRFPKQVMAELARGEADEVSRWANEVESLATAVEPSFEMVKRVMATVGDVIDHSKDAGVDEADPYVLALALTLKEGGDDVRVVTEEKKDSPKKLSMNTAAGMLSVPSVPLAAMLRVERI